MKRNLQRISVLLLTAAFSIPVVAQVRQDTVRESKIDEVVVTALGIKRQDKSLGYSAEKVSSEIFEETQNNNWAQSMEGKVSNLKIQTAGAGPLASARITLRGDISMNMDNNYALIVVDGVPMGNSTTGTGTAYTGYGVMSALIADTSISIDLITKSAPSSSEAPVKVTGSLLMRCRHCGTSVTLRDFTKITPHSSRHANLSRSV